MNQQNNQTVLYLGIQYAVSETRGLCDRAQHHTGGEIRPARVLLTPAVGVGHACIPMCAECFKTCEPVQTVQSGEPQKPRPQPQQENR